MPTWLQYTIHGPFTAKSTRIVQRRDRIVVMDEIDFPNHPIRRSSSFHDDFQCFGCQRRIFDIFDGETFLNEEHENVQFWTPGHGQIEQGPAGTGLHAEGSVGFGIPSDRNGTQLRIDQPLNEIQGAAHDGTMNREPNGKVAKALKARASDKVLAEGAVVYSKRRSCISRDTLHSHRFTMNICKRVSQIDISLRVWDNSRQ